MSESSRKFRCLVILMIFIAVPAAAAPSIQEATRGLEKQEGFFPLYWDAEASRLLMEVPDTGETFLYLPSVASGLGDRRLIGLDRGSPGDEQLAHFERVGARVYLVLENARFRNSNGDEALTRSVVESFPTSTVARFDVVAEEGGRVLFDASSFLVSDVVDVVGTLRRADEGSYRLDADRSRVHLPRTKVFPKNTEVEASLTFVSDRPGDVLERQAPDPRALTLRLHHSFVALPDDGFRPRRFDPRVGLFPVTFYDYSRSFDEGYVVRYAVRHRLVKKDPEAARSELEVPEAVLVLLAPPAFGYRQTLDSRDFTSPAAPAFDQLGIARALAMDVLSDILAPPRAARIAAFADRDPELPTLEEVVGRIVDRTWGEPAAADERALHHVVQRAALDVLIELADNGDATPEARAAAEWGLRRIANGIEASSEADSTNAHVQLARSDIERYLTHHERPPQAKERSRFPWPLSLGDEDPFCSMSNGL